jgi:hypothetical protein
VEAVKIKIDGDPSAGFTLIAIVAATRDTLPLFLVSLWNSGPTTVSSAFDDIKAT